MKCGSHLTEEQKIKISVAHLGMKASPETREKMSTSKKGNKNLLGHRHSTETRMKMSMVQAGHPFRGPEHQRKGNLSPCWKGGKLGTSKREKARRRNLGYAYLNEPFLGCEGHHINAEQVIHIPKKLHHSVYHNQTSGQGMAQINALSYNFLFKQEVETVMRELES